ncbi:MAG: circadian clock protein KaiC [Chromatiaceae bacterium]|nr:MAG: circadian clock protein KaiC [Chromatiaceae bacterium]
MPSSSAFMASGVPGLDDILGGGLRRGHLYFVEGEAGCGKTTVGLQFALQGLRDGESALVVSMAESVAELEIIAESHGWDLGGLAIRDLGGAHAAHPTALFAFSEVELDDRVQAILAEMDTLKPQRLVLDTLAALRALNVQTGQFRRHVELFRSKAMTLGTTMLITDELTGAEDLHPRSLAWGVLRLEQQIGAYGPPRRRLWLPKLRGQAHHEGYHDLRIVRGGVRVFPRLASSADAGSFEAGQIPSGIAQLDALLGGGAARGTSLGIIGPPGTGKSTLLCTFALAAAARGERAALYLFDESIETLKMRAKAQSMDLEPALASGLLLLRQVDPAERPHGELARELALDVSQRDTRIVAIDSLNGYVRAMPDERFTHLHIHALLAWLAKRGVLTLITLAQPSPPTQPCGPAVDLSYIADAVIAQRYFEAYGKIRYAVSVLKKRYGNHERTIREFSIGDTGIIIGEPLAEFRGVLTGTPEYVGQEQPLL